MGNGSGAGALPAAVLRKRRIEMLKNIDRQWGRLDIGGREYRVVINLNSLLYLENCGLPYDNIITQIVSGGWTPETVVRLCHAAMCSLPWNRRAVSARRWEAVRPTLAEIGEMIYPQDLPALKAELFTLLASAMPEPDEGAPAERGKSGTDAGQLRAIFCDVIGRSDEEFWNGTYREIFDRIDGYLKAKGMKKEAVEIQYVDKED